MKIQTTTVTQTANEVLGVEVKNLYYLIIENNEGKKMIVNVGKKTHDSVNALVLDEQSKELEKKQQEEADKKQIKLK